MLADYTEMARAHEISGILKAWCKYKSEGFTY
jgi:hypothetical protein